MEGGIARSVDRETLIAEFDCVRSFTEQLCQPLVADDYQVQSIVQTSPPKWHIAHVSWFFEAFVLPHFQSDYKVFQPDFDYIFNSYYYTHGDMYPRAQRGLLSRPSLDEVYEYRAYINEKMRDLLASVGEAQWQELALRVTLGLNHEQQHQELLLMDIKHNFSANPLKPVYRKNLTVRNSETRPMRWLECGGGVREIGHDGDGFSYDNETPRHEVLIQDHRLADRFVTNAEYLEFIQDGGYSNPALWMSDGWALIHQAQWQHPLYWQGQEGRWQQFSLAGLRPLNPHEPVCHLSFYEADAFARWSGKRLPYEAELELLLEQQPLVGNFVEDDCLHPMPAGDKGQWYGDLWAWTMSPYAAYPGFKPLAGSMGEYNGKFMSNQMVLRGGSCVTSISHCRTSYRNFFYPSERWAFTGLRLAEDV